MLTAIELATVRAALRFWADEMSPHDGRLISAYFDCKLERPLGGAEVLGLRANFEQSHARYLRLTGVRQRRIVDEKLYAIRDLPNDLDGPWGTLLLPAKRGT